MYQIKLRGVKIILQKALSFLIYQVSLPEKFFFINARYTKIVLSVNFKIMC